MESLIDKLSIGSREVTRIDESTCVLPQRRHAALYQQLDEDMRNVNGASNAADNIPTVIKDSIMMEHGSSCRNNNGRKSKASQKRATKLHKRQSVARKTGGIKASLSCNNIKKIKERSLRKQIKDKTNATVQKKRKTKQDMKSMSKSLATFQLR